MVLPAKSEKNCIFCSSDLTLSQKPHIKIRNDARRVDFSSRNKRRILTLPRYFLSRMCFVHRGNKMPTKKACKTLCLIENAFSQGEQNKKISGALAQLQRNYCIWYWIQRLFINMAFVLIVFVVFARWKERTRKTQTRF